MMMILTMIDGDDDNDSDNDDFLLRLVFINMKMIVM